MVKKSLSILAIFVLIIAMSYEANLEAILEQPSTRL